MGGTITVDDAQGGGSVFTVTLPRHIKAAGP
jgi:signal transduction histidine kinase